ncbi:hypothetical protein [Pseudomonas sp. SG20052]|uniref:hypothetical protein n=1 Tax=Pseudomonas sp. SG20052 TaxID=3074147 RepID=UPI00287F730C|nr:hypothetical protein [Pseudomonas sp. SG20052]WNF55809.1 hypothetical protein RHP74_00520 [Pseudomonas sp. SG20052]
MTAYGPEVFDELLKRIHGGQSEVSGTDLGPFRNLLSMGLVEFNGDGGPDRYTGVLLTISGTRRVLDPNGEL